MQNQRNVTYDINTNAYNYVSLHTKHSKCQCSFPALFILIIIMTAVPSSKSCRFGIYICPLIYPVLVQCRVTLDRVLLCTRSNIELRETQCFIMLFSQAPFRFAFQFIPYWSNVESHSTEFYFVPGPIRA
jgi:hypothetical protein